MGLGSSWATSLDIAKIPGRSPYWCLHHVLLEWECKYTVGWWTNWWDEPADMGLPCLDCTWSSYQSWHGDTKVQRQAVDRNTPWDGQSLHVWALHEHSQNDQFPVVRQQEVPNGWCRHNRSSIHAADQCAIPRQRPAGIWALPHESGGPVLCWHLAYELQTPSSKGARGQRGNLKDSIYWTDNHTPKKSVKTIRE